jgi:hypothetical protein
MAAVHPVGLSENESERVEGDNPQTIASRVRRQLPQRYVVPEVWPAPKTALSASSVVGGDELLTGQSPYQTVREVVAARGLPSAPTQINPDLPSDVDAIVTRMCAFRPQDRHATLAQAMEDLTRRLKC